MKYFCKCYAICFIFGLFFIFSSCEKKKSRGLSFDTFTYAFNKAKRGEMVNGIFPLSNDGIDTITIESISVECDCLNSRGTLPRKIPPAHTDTISVIFNTSAAQLGLQKKMVVVKTNGIPRIYELSLTGEISE